MNFIKLLRALFIFPIVVARFEWKAFTKGKFVTSNNMPIETVNYNGPQGYSSIQIVQYSQEQPIGALEIRKKNKNKLLEIPQKASAKERTSSHDYIWNLQLQ